MAQRFLPRSDLRPEQVILLAAARSELGPNHRERILSAIKQEADWDALWDLARSHGVGYFVGRHLQQLNREQRWVARPERSEGRGQMVGVQTTPVEDSGRATRTAHCALPTALAQRIQESLRQETARALALREYQLRLNAEFERLSLPVLWLKGLVLAERLYGKFEARHCGDLDILVEKTQVPRAEKILAGLGFEPYQPSLAGQEFHPMAAHHALWSRRLRDDWLLIVELHHRLSGPPVCQPAVEHLFQRSRTVDFQGQAARIPALEDELLILCLHAHHHNYSLLRCLMDVSEFVKVFPSPGLKAWARENLNWPKLVREARACYCLGRLRAALEITEAVLGLDSAPDIFSKLPALTPRQRWACRRLAVNALLDSAKQNDDRRQAQLTLLMDRWSDIFRLVGPRILPAKEHVRAICPAFLAPYPALPQIYYFWHAFQQMLKCFTETKNVRNGCAFRIY
jgi:hypothetical protein